MKQKLALACTLVHQPAAGAARRADHRRRSGVAPRVLEAALALPRQRHHHPDGDAVPRRGRALPPRGAGPQRPDCWRSTRRARCARRCPGCGSKAFRRRSRDVMRDRLRAAGAPARRGVRRTAARVARHRRHRGRRIAAAARADHAGRPAAASTATSSRPRSKTCSSPGWRSSSPAGRRPEPSHDRLSPIVLGTVTVTFPDAAVSATRDPHRRAAAARRRVSPGAAAALARRRDVPAPSRPAIGWARPAPASRAPRPPSR